MNNTVATTNRPVILMMVLTLLLMLAIPAGLVSLLPKREASPPYLTVDADTTKIKVYLKETKSTVEMPLDEYVKGVVAAEMPADFPLEALKAQAIAARTNAVRKLQQNTLTPEGAHVTDDYRQSQAYSTDEKLKQRWGIVSYQANINKIVQAVNETKGLVVTYNGAPIDALFFSTSNGFTENSQDYFSKALPYLRSVASPWDKQAKHATDETKMTLQEMNNKLGVQTVVTAGNQGQMLKILETTASNRVKKIRVGDKMMTGAQFREVLGLYSSDFSWKVEGNLITFITRGYGHGVGMSQWGAKGMAEAGKAAPEILAYYYQGTTLAPYKKP